MTQLVENICPFFNLPIDDFGSFLQLNLDCMSEESQLTTDQKFSIIQDLMDQINSKSGVVAFRSDDVLYGKTSPAPVHTYQIAGSQITRRTQASNLQQKISSLQAQTAKKQSEPITVVQDDEQQQNQKEIYRYFKSNVRCFRCKKIGHHNYACLDRTLCQFCLATDHNIDKCPQRAVCYRCYQFGHIVDECRSSMGPFCQNCKRKHHKQCCFMTRGTEPIKQMFNTDYLTYDFNIRCIKCLEYGHMVCSAVNSKVYERVENQ